MQPVTANSQNNLDFLHSRSLTGALEQQLEHLILSGEFAPGERLNEIHLSNRFGTSRGPLREALRGLQARGFVEVIRNRGMFIRSISAEEALEIYDLRAAIFGLAGRLLTDLITDDMLQELDTFLDEMDSYASARDFDNYYRTNLAFHYHLVTATGNQTLIDEYRSLVDKLSLCRARGLVQTGAMSISNREHREMVNTLASGDRFRAQEAFFRHVERSKHRFRSTVEGDEKIVPGNSVGMPNKN